jgi:hypothetical protein
MKRLLLMFALVSLATPSNAKQKNTVTIQVVSSQASAQEFQRTWPATAGTAKTTCNTSGDLTNCTTTSTEGQPARPFIQHIPQVHIRVIMPDVSHVTLWCRDVWRRCVSLEPGSYDADLKGDAAWVYTHELSGTMRKTKYHAVGNWSVGP